MNVRTRRSEAPQGLKPSFFKSRNGTAEAVPLQDWFMKPFLVLTFMAATLTHLCAQDLAPRAYVVTPKNSNALTLTWSYFDGGLNFNGAVPIKDASGTYNIGAATVYHSFSFFGCSANVLAGLPYAVGNFNGEVLSQDRSIYRSGLLDFNARLAVNLYGGRAMGVKDFVKWKQKVILGASVRIVAPTGQ